jgi:hypothetical protein
VVWLGDDFQRTSLTHRDEVGLENEALVSWGKVDLLQEGKHLLGLCLEGPPARA